MPADCLTWCYITISAVLLFVLIRNNGKVRNLVCWLLYSHGCSDFRTNDADLRNFNPKYSVLQNISQIAYKFYLFAYVLPKNMRHSPKTPPKGFLIISFGTARNIVMMKLYCVTIRLWTVCMSQQKCINKNNKKLRKTSEGWQHF